MTWEESRDTIQLCSDGVRKGVDGAELGKAHKEGQGRILQVLSEKECQKKDITPPRHEQQQRPRAEEKAEVLSNILPQFLLAVCLPTPLEWMNLKAGTVGAKSLTL